MLTNIETSIDIVEIERQARQMRAEACRQLCRNAANGLRRLIAGRRAPALS